MVSWILGSAWRAWLVVRVPESGRNFLSHFAAVKVESGNWPTGEVLDLFVLDVTLSLVVRLGEG